MIRLVLAAALLLLAGCDLPTRARPAPSGNTASNGGGEANLHNVPRGTTNFPYQQ